MTPGNFNWFLHTMLYYHTKHVLRKQKMAEIKMQEESSDSNIQDSDEDLEEADDK
jgi:hypothetical protein